MGGHVRFSDLFREPHAVAEVQNRLPIPATALGDDGLTSLWLASFGCRTASTSQ
uniref:Uncharacterized protein n=1 Tax=Hyaloperonospora arabidopsidis (strain Emoy2) TaxID=559515 RepID=M4C6E3_HYAAE